MEISGKLIQKLDQQSGEGRNGTWVKQEFILETHGQYPRKVCIALWGDKVKEIENLSIGDSLKAMVNVESREFNGRWYTDVKAWRIETAQSTAGAQNYNAPETPGFNPETSDFGMDNAEENDLPF